MSTFKLLKAPYFKGKGFNPSPIARGGIPPEADSILNPKVIGTPAWESFWNDQIYLCTHGLQTGNIWIPGRMYYYLNFNLMTAGMGVISPDFVDLHLELAYIVEHCITNKKNFICAKKRRIGASEFFQKAKVDYDFRFKNGAYQCGVAAGQDSYAQDFMRKLRTSQSLLPPELRVKFLKDNDDELIAGYKYRAENSGDLIEGGTRNTIYVRTMHRSPSLFKGLFLTDVMAEEAGEFEHLEKFYSHTRPCIMDGSLQIGNFWIWGTGGNMNKGSKDFQKMWEDAKDDDNWVRFLVTAERFHKPFYGGCSLDKPQTPNLLKTHKSFELIGVEDREAALDAILKERQELAKSKNAEKYQEHLKDYPLTEADVFKKTIVNAFDTDIMNDQMDAISSNPKKYIKCHLEYVKDQKTGQIKFPLEVELKVAESNLIEDWNYFLIHVDHLSPVKTHDRLYCAGIDGYDQDLSRTSKSKGGMCVIIRRNTIKDSLQLAPIATIFCRPPQKEKFYEMCVKLSIFYNLINATLPDVRSAGVIKYYQERGCERYLAYRPKKFESENSEQTHVWGVSLNTYSKPLMLGLMQSAVDYFCKGQIWFPELLHQLQNFDVAYIGSDNDLADAYGMALMQDASEEIQPRDHSEWLSVDPFDLGEWVEDSNGNMIPKVKQPNLLSEDHDHPSRWGG